ncbi:putative Rho guanine nucleotide exchange factor 39 [Blattamonas nauphoetae]|uniref:Rho guanine nucleotide exchange factor 39 n=1 Tax=Blattamonas nauphoetae TaxID=2049346 RepID=A0ABQ9Y9V8_9EUKA|nr:putative Rho guanine nucleotide exchange factor 39 [Blattamonas nauphoetae]
MESDPQAALFTSSAFAQPQPVDNVTKLCEEIIETEKVYLKALSVIENLFHIPLQRCVDARGISVPSNDLSAIFLNTPQLLSLHTSLCSALQSKKLNTSIALHVGKQFCSFGPFFKLYSDYCKHYENSLSLLQKWMLQDLSFSALVNTISHRPDVSESLDSLLIRPVQRLPRYRLLLLEILKYLKDDEKSEKLIQKAIDIVTSAAVFVNVAVKAHQSALRLAELRIHLSEWTDFGKGTEKLHFEGECEEVEVNRTSKQHLILFNEKLILCRQKRLSTKLNVGLVILLNDSDFLFGRRGKKSGADESLFVLSKYSSSLLLFTSTTTCQAFREALNEALTELSHTNRVVFISNSLERNDTREPTYISPQSSLKRRKSVFAAPKKREVGGGRIIQNLGDSPFPLFVPSESVLWKEVLQEVFEKEENNEEEEKKEGEINGRAKEKEHAKTGEKNGTNTTKQEPVSLSHDPAHPSQIQTEIKTKVPHWVLSPTHPSSSRIRMVPTPHTITDNSEEESDQLDTQQETKKMIPKEESAGPAPLPLTTSPPPPPSSLQFNQSLQNKTVQPQPQAKVDPDQQKRSMARIVKRNSTNTLHPPQNSSAVQRSALLSSSLAPSSLSSSSSQQTSRPVASSSFKAKLNMFQSQPHPHPSPPADKDNLIIKPEDTIKTNSNFMSSTQPTRSPKVPTRKPPPPHKAGFGGGSFAGVESGNKRADYVSSPYFTAPLFTVERVPNQSSTTVFRFICVSLIELAHRKTAFTKTECERAVLILSHLRTTVDSRHLVLFLNPPPCQLADLLHTLRVFLCVGNAALTAEVVATLQWVCLDEGNARGVVHSDLVEVLFTKAHPENTPISHPTLHTDTLRLLHSLLRFTCFSTRPNPTSTSPHSNKLPTASFASLLHNSVLAPSLPYLLFLAPSPSSLPDSPPNSYLFCLILRLMEFATAHHPTLLLFQHSHLSISFVRMILQTQHSGLLFWHITDFVDTLQRWSMELPVIAQQGRECVALLDQEGLLDALEALVFAAEGGQRRYGGETVRTASMNAFRERGGNG